VKHGLKFETIALDRQVVEAYYDTESRCALGKLFSRGRPPPGFWFLAFATGAVISAEGRTHGDKA